MGLSAVVVGATGAVGEALVHQLVKNPAFTCISTIGRRPLEGVPEEGRTAEFRQIQVNMDALETEGVQACKGADLVFCALGTTRQTAGSAEQFKKVDYEYVAASARLAQACGVKHFSLVSAQGANHKCPANDWGIFHGLLYTKTKGLAEQAVLQQGFARTSIYRPGLLERGTKTRSAEKMFSFLSSLDVKDLARMMISDALRNPATAQPVMTFEMAALQKSKKVLDQPPSTA